MRRGLRAVALLLLLAAAVSAAESISEKRGSHTLGRKTTEKRKHDLPVPEGTRHIRLRLKAFVREGEIKFVVRDGRGHIFQEAHLSPSRTKPNIYDVDTGEMKSAEGVWTIEVELKDALGSYEYMWRAELAE